MTLDDLLELLCEYRVSHPGTTPVMFVADNINNNYNWYSIGGASTEDTEDGVTVLTIIEED